MARAAVRHPTVGYQTLSNDEYQSNLAFACNRHVSMLKHDKTKEFRIVPGMLGFWQPDSLWSENEILRVTAGHKTDAYSKR